MNFRPIITQFAWIMMSAAWPVLGQSITSFSPSAGAPGDTVVLHGSGFYNGGPVTIQFWNKKTATIIYVNSDTQITVSVPNGVSTGPISVFRSGGQIHYSPNDFTVVGSGPYIMGFSPAYAAINSPNSVLINGVHFSGATSVRFNGVPANFQVSTIEGTNVIHAYIPAGATTGPISVTTPNGTGHSDQSFVVVGAQVPYVATFSPLTGNPGDSVVLTGLHFTSTTAVKFGGVNASFRTPTSDTELTAYVPAGAMSGPITVVNPYGTATSATNFYFTPQITGFQPAAAPPGVTVAITGRSLTNASALTFNGLSASFAVDSNTRITAVVPDGASTGPIRVTAPAGQSLPSADFVVSPVITGFSPRSGGEGASVTISGQNLLGATAVTFNGVSASFGAVTYGHLTAFVPAAATTGPIAVTTPDGTASSGTNFFYAPASFDSFSPTTGNVGSTVTIRGENFIGATAVTFDGIPAEFVVTNNTTIGAVVPSGASSGPISVTTTAGTVSSGSQSFYLPPVISGFTPKHGLPGTNVTVFGENLLGATVVKFNQTSVTFVPLTNNTSFQVTVPPQATTGLISLTAPAGTAVSSEPFILDYASDLAVLVNASSNSVYVGSNLTYTITITNAGPFSAPDAVLSNTLPASVTLQSATYSAGLLTTNGDSLVLSLNPLTVSNSATLSLQVVPQTLGTITNRAVVFSAYPDPNPSDDADRVVTTVLAVPPPPPPALLTIEPYSSTLLKISWPLALSNYDLQFTPDLGTDAAWSYLTSQPIVSGTSNVVFEPSTASQRFYRLKQ